MKLVGYLLLAIVSLFSCHAPNCDHYKNLLIGDWLFIGAFTPHKPYKGEKKDPFDLLSLNMNLIGYTFKEDGFCEKLPGYFLYNPESHYEEFYGKNTKYILYGDSLKIFNLVANDWNKGKISNLTDSSLIFQMDDTLSFIYRRNIQPAGKKLSFDKIIISSNDGYIVNDIMVSRGGEIVYHDESHYGYNGLFTSKISTNDFQSIEDDFNKADINELKDNYKCTNSEFNAVTVTFIKDGKIYKTITDENAQASKEFYWAYHPMTYFYQLLKLEKANRDTRFPNGISGIGINNKLIELKQPEGFYLSSLLMSAKVVKERFKEDYFLYYLDENELGKITTDGRFYRIKSKKGTAVTLDLGYNFILENELMKRVSKN